MGTSCGCAEDCQTLRVGRQVGRYIAMTGLSAAVTLGLPILLHERLAIAEEAAVALALSAAFVLNFLTLRLFVFGSRGGAVRELLKFGATSAGFRFGEYLGFLMLHRILGVNYVMAISAMLALSIVLKFIVYKLFVFLGKPVVAAQR